MSEKMILLVMQQKRYNAPYKDYVWFCRSCAYVYLIYGMYYCLNIVTEQQGFPAAVLIRGVYQYSPLQVLLDGPSKLCSTLGINKTQNGQDVTSNKSFCIIDVGNTPKFISTPRIGIIKGTDRL